MKNLKTLLIKTLTIVCAFVAVVSLAACDGSNKNAKVKVLEYELTSEDYAFAVAKDNDALLEAANALIKELIDTKELDKIINSFFDGTSTFKYENPVNNVPAGSEREKYLVVATNAYFPPFEYYEGVAFSGVDIQIAKLLADKLNKTLYVNDMDFDAVLPSVTEKLSDIGMAGLTVNEKRLQTVNFTTEYYTSAQVLIVKADDKTFDECKSAADIEAVLAKQSSSFKVGAQNGTTGYMYSAGDVDFEYDGFPNLETKGYTTGALAVKDLANDVINAVIIDKQPALMIAKNINR